ncbi:MAG TPA: GWxTD domain-containing protein [Bryobacterales bacterium]|nr:GWxTD domain-containing protein [Bryobacterales bacterium]
MRRMRVVGFLVAFIVLFLPCAPLSGAEEEVPRPLTKKEEKKRLDRLRKELRGPFKKWMREDVRYILTDDERKAFLRLSTDEERENFIESFWLRRDPTPDSVENEYREEHYRRIAYANEKFASGIPGWKADRGRIYITFGPPDEIESHPSGGSYQRPYEEGGGTTSTYPFEIWRYRWIEGVGQDVLIEFVDPTMTGEYRMTLDPAEKDALLYVPGAGLTIAEQLGLSEKRDRFMRTDGTRMGNPIGGAQSMRYNQFERLQRWAALQKPPEIKFKDLEAVVDSSVQYNTLPVRVEVQYSRITNEAILTGVTVQLENKDLVFREEGGRHKAIVNIYGRVTTMTRRVAAVFEDVVTVDTTAERLPYESERSALYQKPLILPPGTYRLEVVSKDVVGETMSTYRTALEVPLFDDESLAASSLILADRIERVPVRSLGLGQFVIGGSKVRPRITEEFRQDERLGIYLQVYNLGADSTAEPQGSVTYQVARLDQPNELLLDFTEQINQIRGATSKQLIVEKLLPLQTLNPGEYRLSLKVTDSVKNETLAPTTTFKIK